MDEPYKLPHYDPDYCRKVVKWAAFFSLASLVIVVLILLVVDPSNGSCPRWVINANKPSAISLWVLTALLGAPPTIWICYVAWNWDREYAQKAYDDFAYKPKTPPKFFASQPEPNRDELDFGRIFLVNANRQVLRVSIMWSLFCALPLWVMLSECTSLPGYLMHRSSDLLYRYLGI